MRVDAIQAIEAKRGDALAGDRQAEQDRRIASAFARDASRLRQFIRRRVPDAADADDILQDVFAELVESFRGAHPIDLASAWLYRVARNRIIDLFRRRKPSSLDEPIASGTSATSGSNARGHRGGDDDVTLEDLLPSPDEGPAAAYARSVLAEELEAAIDALPEEQRAVFLAHAVDGVSFKTLAERTGVSINTLLARKRYAVRRLRERLQDVYDELWDR